MILFGQLGMGLIVEIQLDSAEVEDITSLACELQEGFFVQTYMDSGKRIARFTCSAEHSMTELVRRVSSVLAGSGKTYSFKVGS